MGGGLVGWGRFEVGTVEKGWVERREAWRVQIIIIIIIIIKGGKGGAEERRGGGGGGALKGKKPPKTRGKIMGF